LQLRVKKSTSGVKKISSRFWHFISDYSGFRTRKHSIFEFISSNSEKKSCNYYFFQWWKQASTENCKNTHE